MADLPDQVPFEGLHPRKPAGRRRLSYASQNSGSLRSHNPGQRVSSALSIRSHFSYAGSETDQSEIHSPIPSRHFLLQTESQEWLNSAQESVTSSRPSTPLSPISPTEGSFKPPSLRKTRREPALSFSTLHELHQSYPNQKLRKPPPVGSISSRIHAKSRAEFQTNDNVGMGRRWIKWMHRNRMQDRVLVCSVAAALWLKWCVGLSGYSGAGVPPLYGDFEAQRHWMELTIHLPTRQWYTYDLAYWGLDYPPLTAYHSWLCGIIGSLINPKWFELDGSRGIETYGSKLFMRSTVLVSDLLLYIPALIFFSRAWHNTRSKRTQGLALLCLLLQPSLILVDSGHFQYNSVMLGFTLMALNFFSQGRDEIGAICFVGSLVFKQMSLYYAPAIGAYLLGRCISLGRTKGFNLFLRLAATTVLSFIVAFLPFLPPFSPLSGILDPITRIFPFHRGLFEDKVANFWCASNVIIKWRLWLSQPILVKISAALTLLGFLPSATSLVWAGWKVMESLDSPSVPALLLSSKSSERGSISSVNTNSTNHKITTFSITTNDNTRNNGVVATPTLPILPWAMLASSMSFFLFSFQVHEKTILLPLLPLNLLLSGASIDSFTFEWGVLVNNVAVFSMWPLLKKDGLAIPYIALTLLWNQLLGSNPFRKPNKEHYLLNYVSLTIYTLILTLHISEFLITPPNRYPDLFPVLNVLVCTPVFGFTWLWSIKRSVEVAWGVGLSLS